MLLGADSIDDCDVLRSGRTARVLGHRVMAPSTLGTFLRAFTFGHVRQLDRVLGELLGRAWRAGAGPGPQRLVVDVDSFIQEVHGKQKQGASYGYTSKLGYHPLVATRSGSGEVLHMRFRTGRANSQRGIIRFTDELIARVRRAGARGEILLRADSGFHNRALRVRLAGKGVLYSISVRLTAPTLAAIGVIAEDARVALADYPKTGEAQIAETTVKGERLIVRRVRLVGPQAHLFPTWRHYAALTNRTEPLAIVEAEHRDHANVELEIRDLVDQALAHAPSGQFSAKRRVDGDRRDRAQPAPLDRTDRPPGHHHPPRAHQPSTDALDARPADPPQPRQHPSPPRPLALANRLACRTDQNPRATRAHLTPATRPARPGPEHPSNQPAPRRPAGNHRCSERAPERFRATANTPTRLRGTAKTRRPASPTAQTRPDNTISPNPASPRWFEA
jgi:Transposase DDE domain group 1